MRQFACTRLQVAGCFEPRRGISTMKVRVGSIFSGLVAVVACSTAYSATLKSTPGKDGQMIIQISGEIAEGDTDVFINAVKQANAAGKLVANVRLNSAGGNLLEGVK